MKRAPPQASQHSGGAGSKRKSKPKARRASRAGFSFSRQETYVPPDSPVQEQGGGHLLQLEKGRRSQSDSKLPFPHGSGHQSKGSRRSSCPGLPDIHQRGSRNDQRRGFDFWKANKDAEDRQKNERLTAERDADAHAAFLAVLAQKEQALQQRRTELMGTTPWNDDELVDTNSQQVKGMLLMARLRTQWRGQMQQQNERAGHAATRRAKELTRQKNVESDRVANQRKARHDQVITRQLRRLSENSEERRRSMP